MRTTGDFLAIKQKDIPLIRTHIQFKLFIVYRNKVTPEPHKKWLFLIKILWASLSKHCPAPFIMTFVPNPCGLINRLYILTKIRISTRESLLAKHLFNIIRNSIHSQDSHYRKEYLFHIP